MYRFRIKIAGHIIDVETLHTRPQAICRKYITDGVPDLWIKTEQSEIDKEKKVIESRNYGIRDAWDGVAEEYTLLRLIANSLADYGVFLFHGAAIALNGQGYVFTGDSGTGKTTHIRLWMKNKPDTIVVNGDKPFILADDIPMICGSPWAGKEGINTNTMVPLHAIVIMKRSETNYMQQISISEAFPFLYQQTYRIEEFDKTRAILQMLKSLDGKISFYFFHFNNFADDCFQVAYNTLINGITAK